MTSAQDSIQIYVCLMYVCLFDLFIHSFIHSEYFYSASLSHRLCLSFLSQPVSASHVTGCLSLRPQPVSASPQTVYAYRYALVLKGLTDWLELLVSDCNIGSSLNKSKVLLLLLLLPLSLPSQVFYYIISK